MKNIILILTICLSYTFSTANYVMKFPLEVSNGGVLPNGSISIKPLDVPILTPPENLDFTKISVGVFPAPNGKTYIGYSSGVEPTHGVFGGLIRSGIKNVNGFYINQNSPTNCELNITGTNNIVNSISTIRILNVDYTTNYIWQQPLNGSYLNRRSVNCSLFNDLQNLIENDINIEFI